MQFFNIAHLDSILFRVLFISQYSHPNFVQVVKSGHEKDCFLCSKVDDSIMVHFSRAEEIIEVSLLVVGIGYVTAVKRYLRCALKDSNGLVLLTHLHLLFEEANESCTVLHES